MGRDSDDDWTAPPSKRAPAPKNASGLRPRSPAAGSGGLPAHADNEWRRRKKEPPPTDTFVQPAPPSQVRVNVKLPPGRCPRCEGMMVTRRNGVTGERFWGCSNFPSCKGTRRY
jgi:hypothetical protein